MSATIAEGGTSGYEVKILPNLAGKDLVIFEIGFNDLFQDQSDLEIANVDLNSRDRKTFIGSLNYVIDKMLKAKPSQKFAFITHHNNINYIINATNLNLAIERIAAHWNAPVFKLYEKTGWNTPELINYYTLDGIHWKKDGVDAAPGAALANQYYTEWIRNLVIN